MGFIKKLNDTTKCCDLAECYKKQLNNNYVFCYSYNHKSIPFVNDETKYIIVGTFTPPVATTNDDRSEKNEQKMNNCYFYWSKSPKQITYKLLDYALDPQYKLENAKNNNDVQSIKNILSEYGIAFLDVIECAIAPNDNTDDDEILNYCLDLNTFEYIFDKYPNIQYLPNSKNALEALKKIKKEIKKEIKIKVINFGDRRELPFFQNPRCARYGENKTLDLLKRQYKDALTEGEPSTDEYTFELI